MDAIKSLRKPARILWMGIIFGAAMTASAQYELQTLANFEDGQIPSNVMLLGEQASAKLKVVSVSDVTTAPAEFKNPEVGERVLAVDINPVKTRSGTWQTGFAVVDVLDRSTLGPNGRALFQCDFFLDTGGNPSVAVLATEPSSASSLPSLQGAFYRFGITKGDRLYFSNVRPGEATAAVYQQDKELLAKIPKPGWHRFAIVCEGPELIRCYVDGREAPFSPIRDTSIPQLQVGMLLADQDRAYTAYIDNLSIQKSDEAPGLPQSPYDAGWSIPAGPSMKSRNEGVNTVVAPTVKSASQSSMESTWLLPTEAWRRAQAEKKGLLLYFYAPGIARTEKMNEILNSDPAAKAYIARHSNARVDVNQLEGGSIAKKYNIYKVPTFLVISPDATRFRKVSPGPGDDWKSIEAQLGDL